MRYRSQISEEEINEIENNPDYLGRGIDGVIYAVAKETFLRIPIEMVHKRNPRRNRESNSVRLSIHHHNIDIKTIRDFFDRIRTVLLVKFKDDVRLRHSKRYYYKCTEFHISYGFRV